MPSPPPSFHDDSSPESDSCVRCGKDAASGWICTRCDDAFCCDQCWNSWDPHKKEAKRPSRFARKTHEKVHRDVFYRLTRIFAQHQTKERQFLHEQEAKAKWFGIYRDYGDNICFGDTNRFRVIMNEGLTAEHPEQFPSLVSFIGQTGSGKSTVINLLMTLTDDTILGPVSGCSGDPSPTTGDVHLYADPDTHKTRSPLLFADCEGLEGGDQTPIALRSVKDLDVFRKRDHIVERIPWAEHRKRDAVVVDLFPKLLYTFSDVVAYTLKEARTLESIATKYLIPWAAESIYKSLNQAVRPHVIIILNAVNPNLPKADWGIKQSTEKYIGALDIGFQHDPYLEALAVGLSQDAGISIKTIDGLLKHYYSSVTVVLIPEKGHHNLMNEQVRKLYTVIKDKSEMAQKGKAAARMLLDAERLNQFLALAFDHFSQYADKPFDFMNESLRQNPLPGTFGGNFVQLALAAQRVGDRRSGGPIRNPAELFDRLLPLISSYITLDAERSSLIGPYTTLLTMIYQTHLKEAFNCFCNLWLPCTYERKGARCCNFRSTHGQKGHQRVDGKIFGTGPFENEFQPEVFFDGWIKRVKEDLNELTSNIRKDPLSSSGITAAVKIHRDRISAFVSELNNPTNFASAQVCFWCLRYDMPQHLLPCCHALCDDCIKTFSDESKSDQDGRRYSVLCSFHSRNKLSHPITVKPRHAGVRILCLDGGGVRGIIQLALLRAIEDEFKGNLKIQWLFDLVVGTSTGGIIALGLFAKGQPLGECTEDFRSICRKAFTKREFRSIPFFGKLAIMHHGSIYKTTPFESMLRDKFEDDALLFGNKWAPNQCRVKVAVTSTETTVKQQPVIFANYNRPLERATDKPSYRFIREEKLCDEIKIWEAARATSAAMPYFKSFFTSQTRREYIDGGLYNNCPVNVAYNERRLLWGDVTPDILLSLGTGQHPRENHTASLGTLIGASSKTPKRRHLLAEAWDVVVGLLDNIFECQGVWKQFVEDVGKAHSNKPDIMSRYIRMNIEIPNGVPQLDKLDQLERLEGLVSGKATTKAKEIAHRLVASCFYFNPEPEPPAWESAAGRWKVRGQIKCRFDEKGEQLKGLGRFLRDCLGQFTPTFYLQQEYGLAHEEIPIADPASLIRDMCNPGTFSVSVSSSSSTVVRLSICLQKGVYESSGDCYLPISGFPQRVEPRRTVRKVAAHQEALQPLSRPSSPQIQEPPPYSAM
ncbi:hypothetical protein F5Y19DRAFT_445247 [Xylariaceae sp. FL1651]|nr:hypothetical protein F5Y19DRAFT_445247 [Xylariaceae sp. FL1651]